MQFPFSCRLFFRIVLLCLSLLLFPELSGARGEMVGLRKAEMDVGRDFLEDRGVSDVCLTLYKEYPDYVVFNDNARQRFVVVAAQKYWDYLDTPVLAYGWEGTYVMDESADMLDGYAAQLRKMVGKGVKAYHTGRDMACLPLLSDIMWGQNAPYNNKCPKKKGKRVPVGCVPVAVAQLLKFYEHPRETKGVGHMEGWKPKLSQLRKHYSETDEDGDEVAELMYRLARALGADFDSDGTAASLADVPRILINNFRYAGCVHYYNQESSGPFLVSLLLRELEAGRPCLAANEDHAFVCDGFAGDYVHCNMGWNGLCNGYYRVLPAESWTDGDRHILIREVVVGIRPHKDVERTVTIDVPGTLAESLSSGESVRITRLTVRGQLNSADMRWLRKMAGAVDDSLPGFEGLGGCLASLNLSEAGFVADEEPVFSERAQGIWTYTTQINGEIEKVTFDLTHMSAEEWELFCRTIGDSRPGQRYERVSDTVCQVHYTLLPDSLPACAFSRCTALRELLLPESIRHIGNRAFEYCTALTRVVLPPALETSGEDIYRGCESLGTEEVETEGGELADEGYGKASDVLSYGMMAVGMCLFLIVLGVIVYYLRNKRIKTPVQRPSSRRHVRRR